MSALTTRARALPIHDEMMQQQANDLVRREGVAVAVHAADAVGVAVRHEAEVMRMRPQEFLARPVIFLDGFRVDAAEQHVVARIERGDFARRAGEQLLETARADAEQRVVGETQF